MILVYLFSVRINTHPNLSNFDRSLDIQRVFFVVLNVQSRGCDKAESEMGAFL